MTSVIRRLFKNRKIKFTRSYWDEVFSPSGIVHGAADYAASSAGFAIAGPMGAIVAPFVIEPAALWVGEQVGFTGEAKHQPIGWNEEDRHNYDLAMGNISLKEWYVWKLDFEERRRNWLTVGSQTNRGFGSTRMVVSRDNLARLNLPRCKDGYHLRNGVCVLKKNLTEF
jgi:hypothetical protein